MFLIGLMLLALVIAYLLLGALVHFCASVVGRP